MNTRIIRGIPALNLVVAVLFASMQTPLLGQPNNPPRAAIRTGPSEEADRTTRFSLDFPGGTPADLVEAISSAAEIRLNAIIPDEHANVQLPALRMTEVTAPRLFQALSMATRRTVRYAVGFTDYGVSPDGRNTRTQYQVFETYASFETPETTIDDNTVWYFTSPQSPFPTDAPPPPAPAKACQFFQLAPYLEFYKVEDVTTAVQTAWKMLGESQPPSLSFHEDTKLLIAVGEPEKLMLIQDVLVQLVVPPPTTSSGQTTDRQDEQAEDR